MDKKAFAKIPGDVLDMIFSGTKYSIGIEELTGKLIDSITFLVKDFSNPYFKRTLGLLAGSFKVTSYKDYKVFQNLVESLKDRREKRYGYAIKSAIVSLIRMSIFKRQDGKVRSEVKTTYERENRYYDYIPYNSTKFVDLLHQITRFFRTKNLRTKKFIDVGCGIGDKTLFANLMGYDAYGIEFNEHTYNLGIHYLKGVENCKLIQGDAFSHDFSQYDIIYLFVPIAKHELMVKLHKYIYSTMKIGAKIFEVGMGVRTLYADIFGEGPEKRAPYRGVIQKTKKGPWIRKLEG